MHHVIIKWQNHGRHVCCDGAHQTRIHRSERLQFAWISLILEPPNDLPHIQHPSLISSVGIKNSNLYQNSMCIIAPINTKLATMLRLLTLVAVVLIPIDCIGSPQPCKNKILYIVLNYMPKGKFQVCGKQNVVLFCPDEFQLVDCALHMSFCTCSRPELH